MSAATVHPDEEIITGINVTPLVDVTLVLLIIFMVTASYIMARSIPVDLPAAGTGEDVVTTFAITITAEGATYLDGKRAGDADIREGIREARAARKDVRVVIAADRDVRHGRVVGAIDLIRKEGVSKFAINIDNEDAR
jgi:biopolymer transport protein ExbD